MDDIYQRVSIFKELSPEHLTQVQAIAQHKEVAKGQAIFSEGDIGDAMYIIEQGRVRLTHTVSLGIEKTLLVLEEGNLFGEMALMTTGTRSATATAEEDCSLLIFRQDAFFSLIQNHQDIGIIILRNMLQLLTDRLRITTNGYLQSIAWGLEVSGATSLNFDKVIKDQLSIEITCHNNIIVKGQLLKVEKNGIGMDLIMKDIYSKIIMIPYHAIITIDVNYEGIRLV